MPSYTLEIEAIGIFATNAPSLEIWEDGVLDSTTVLSASGTTIFATITYSGTIPTSLEFTFNDAFAPAGRIIEVRSVKINDKYVNVGNYLSSDSLTFGQTSTVDIASVNTSDSDFIFDSADPALSEFTSGATQTFTIVNDTYRNYNGLTNEVFDMLDGRDVAYLGSGNDKVNGGAGNDIIRGGAGSDLLYGGANDDKIYGGADDDTIYGGTGNDRLHGNGGNDEIHGGDGNDRLNGHEGDDVITGGLGIDRINGGIGNDFLYGGGGDDNIVAGDGDDTVDGGANNDILYGGIGNDYINGGLGNDQIIGGDGIDILQGNEGDDTFFLEPNDFVAGEEIYGGVGTDQIIISRAGTLDFTVGIVTEVEGMFGTTGNDTINITASQIVGFANIDLDTGTDNINTRISGTADLSAFSAPSIINAENGYLIGSAGIDNLTISGAQLDALIYGTGILDFGGSVDVLNLTSTSSVLNILAATNASIIGLETIDASAALAGVTITLNNVQTENFTITGSNQIDTIRGGGGNDVIDGGVGDDDITGGSGNDNIQGGTGADTIHGGGDQDTISGGIGNDIFTINSADFVAGESIDGGADSDTILFTMATTTDFTVGTLTDIEILNGSIGNDNVTIAASQLVGFTTIDLNVGTDTINTTVSGTVDLSSFSAPTTLNVEIGNLIGSAGADVLTISGAQLDAILEGTGSIIFDTGADILELSSTSTDLNDLGINSNASITGLGTIDGSGAGAGIFVSMSGQSEAFDITGGGFDDILTGGLNNDTINGGIGNDILTGLAGGDTINGGDGNDIMLGGDGNDILTGGDGDDTIYGATIIGESGIESVIQSSASTWFTVTFSATILNPVVKMSNLTNNDTVQSPGSSINDPYTIRVRNLTETGFEYQLREFDYLDGVRSVAEDVSWLAISEGTHTLDNGAVIQAGRASVTNETQTTVTFDSAFGSAPVVLTQVITDNDPAAVVTRNRSVTATGFNVNLLEEEIADGIHATEEIGYIAIDEVGSPASGFLVGQTAPTLVSHAVTTINFGGTFSNAPVFVHDQQTVNGGDTSYSQADGITTTTARVFIREEQSGDAEVSHGGRESVGYFALNEGLLTEAGGGDNTLSGGAGVDTLFGGDGADTFIFELATAFGVLNQDILADFSTGEGDTLDISDLISGFSGTITDYVNFDDSSGTDTIVEIDRDGTAGGFGFEAIAQINGITGLDEATLYTNGNIIV